MFVLHYPPNVQTLTCSRIVSATHGNTTLGQWNGTFRESAPEYFPCSYLSTLYDDGNWINSEINLVRIEKNLQNPNNLSNRQDSVSVSVQWRQYPVMRVIETSQEHRIYEGFRLDWSCAWNDKGSITSIRTNGAHPKHSISSGYTIERSPSDEANSFINEHHVGHLLVHWFQLEMLPLQLTPPNTYLRHRNLGTHRGPSE